MDKIDKIRSRINLIDDKLMSLLEERYELTNKIGILKKDSNIVVLDTNREDLIYAKTSKYSHYPQIKLVYSTIMAESKKAQRK